MNKKGEKERPESGMHYAHENRASRKQFDEKKIELLNATSVPLPPNTSWRRPRPSNSLSFVPV